MGAVRDHITRPLRDYTEAVAAAVAGHGVAAVALVVAAAAVAWWIYVPVHELLHAYGCLWTGGSVTRLDIDAVYGAALLRRWFPFVHVGSAYAGQLSGFDTHGSDVTYLVTVGAPFVLTVLVGVPLLQSAAGGRRAWWNRCLRLGAALPVAYAPFISLGGDYYEAGSILVSRAWAVARPEFPVARWRSDDLVALAGRLLDDPQAGVADAVGVSLGCAIGVVLAFVTYAAGTWCGQGYCRMLRGRPREGERPADGAVAPRGPADGPSLPPAAR